MAAVIGGVGAGLRFDDAVLVQTEEGLHGPVVFAAPRSAEARSRDLGVRSVPDRGAPFQLSVVQAAVTDIAVAIVQLRGEPTRFERILGEVLLGLDQLGHLRRLVGTPRTAPEDADDEAEDEADSDPAAGQGAGQGYRQPGFFGLVSDVPAEEEGGTARGAVEPGAPGGGPPAPVLDPTASPPPVAAGTGGTTWQEVAPAGDPVRLTLDIIRRELRRPDQQRLQEVEEDLWWLRDPRDLAAAKASLSERVEWAIFSLLSTSGGISQASFDERVGRLFRGPETADRRARGGLPRQLSLRGAGRPMASSGPTESLPQPLCRARRDGGPADRLRPSPGHARLDHASASSAAATRASPWPSC